jgi:predicted nucleotidyltransferase
MKPSAALETHRDEIRRIIAANRGLNPRVFGSVLHQEDTGTSDLDLLIDAGEGLSLFDMAEMALAIERLVQTRVDVKTPEDLSIRFRQQVVAEARPI